MLVRGQTTEDRIGEIANKFAQGLGGIGQGLKSQADAINTQRQYEDSIALKRAELEANKAARERAFKQDAMAAEKNAVDMQYKQAQIGELMAPAGTSKKFIESNMLAKTKASASASAKPSAESKVTQKQMEKLGVGNAGLYNVKSAMDEALKILEDPATGEDQKIKTGQSLFKLLNSAEGSDAVGAEEAKRIGSYLEYNIGNFTQPGAFIGRDVKGFTDQIKNYSKLLGSRISKNEQGIETLKGGGSLSSISQPVTTNQSSTQRINPEHINAVKSMSDADLIKFIQGQ